MSDSSEDEICLPSLRDKILTSVSYSKSISSSETITSMKQKLSSENKSDKTALNHLNSDSMHSKVLASNGYSSTLACSEDTVFSDRSISTNNFDSNLDSQSTVSLSQSSGCSVGDLTKKKRTKEEIAALKNEATASILFCQYFLLDSFNNLQNININFGLGDLHCTFFSKI